jgi:hypothetical protein
LWASPGRRTGAVFHLTLPPADARETPAQADPAAMQVRPGANDRVAPIPAK